MNSVADAPKVFVSYSHDSEEHKDWVRDLAARLLNDGVYVVLDHWDIEFGDDVTAFMERGLASCDRVLIICTEDYVTKANTLRGGVRYEKMIITAEAAQNLETKKFIPVLRSGDPDKLPPFLGTRMYVDFRSGDLHYEALLRALLGVPKHKRPPLGRNPFGGLPVSEVQDGRTLSSKRVMLPLKEEEKKLMAEQADEVEDWKFHWHGAVHRHFGNKLHFIQLRFATASIFLKESILHDLQKANIFDYMIFHLYSHWDLLIRVWANDESIGALKARFSNNPDLHRRRPPEYIAVEGLSHHSNGVTHPSDVEIQQICGRPGFFDEAKDVQARGWRSPYFKEFKKCRIILDNKIRFDEERIQFYITINSIHALEVATVRAIEQLMQKAGEISNRTVFKTSGACRAIIKGQVADFYQINECLRSITAELEDRLSENVVTETLLVASRDRIEATAIDFESVEPYAQEQSFRHIFPEAMELPFKMRRRLQEAYAEIRHMSDKSQIFYKLIKAKAVDSPEDLGKATVFFATFEELLRSSLVRVAVTTYRDDWQSVIDQIKADEKITTKDIKLMALGDLGKIYRRIILEKGIIDISPLSEAEFSKLIDEVAKQRNRLAHSRPDLAQWEDLFAICKLFVPIHDRFVAYFESLK